MNFIKRAIIMAAGSGTRLRPVTLETPKPLIKVNGKRMIDTIIEGLHLNGIHEIYVVTGYKKEAFKDLPKEYPGLNLIENPYFNTANNISSLYAAREYLEDVFIIDGDQILEKPEILRPEFDKSGYCAAWAEETDEWLLTLKKDTVVGCSRTGGRNGYQLYGVSMWSKEDGKKLREHLELEFTQKNNRDIYWDDIAVFCYPQMYRLGIRKINHGDIKEIDSFKELIDIDGSYEIYK